VKTAVRDATRMQPDLFLICSGNSCSTWGERCAEFAFYLFLITLFKNTLLPASLFGFFTTGNDKGVAMMQSYANSMHQALGFSAPVLLAALRTPVLGCLSFDFASSSKRSHPVLHTRSFLHSSYISGMIFRLEVTFALWYGCCLLSSPYAGVSSSCQQSEYRWQWKEIGSQ
jgi:hypothetical protein